MNTESNPRRIAVLRVAPCEGSIHFGKTHPNHYRYTLYERKVRVGMDFYSKLTFARVSKVLLRYDDLSIEDFFAQCRYSFGVSRNLAASATIVRDAEGPNVAADVSMTISGSDSMIGHFLGVIDGYHCYAVYKDSDVTHRQVPYNFSIRSVPDHGLANVIYEPDVVRSAFEKPNITQTHLRTEDSFDELALFDKMDALIAPIMAPMVALLPPVKE